MVLQKQVIPVPFVNGLDKKTDELAAKINGGFINLENVRLNTVGAATTRPGVIAQTLDMLDTSKEIVSSQSFLEGLQNKYLVGKQQTVSGHAVASDDGKSIYRMLSSSTANHINVQKLGNYEPLTLSTHVIGNPRGGQAFISSYYWDNIKNIKSAYDPTTNRYCIVVSNKGSGLGEPTDVFVIDGSNWRILYQRLCGPYATDPHFWTHTCDVVAVDGNFLILAYEYENLITNQTYINRLVASTLVMTESIATFSGSFIHVGAMTYSTSGTCAWILTDGATLDCRVYDKNGSYQAIITCYTHPSYEYATGACCKRVYNSATSTYYICVFWLETYSGHSYPYYVLINTSGTIVRTATNLEGATYIVDNYSDVDIKDPFFDVCEDNSYDTTKTGIHFYMSMKANGGNLNNDGYKDYLGGKTYQWIDYFSASAPINLGNSITKCHPIGGAITFQNKPAIMLLHSSGKENDGYFLQNTYLLATPCSTTTSHVIMKIFNGNAEGFYHPTTPAHILNFNCIRQMHINTNGDLVFFGTNHDNVLNDVPTLTVIIVSANTSILSNALHNGKTNLCHGRVDVIDDVSSMPVGFPIYPESIVAVDISDVEIPRGTGAHFYSFCATYSIIDSNGDFHESAPSPIATYATEPFFLYINGPSPSSKFYDIYVNLYGTGQDGTIFYLNSSVQVTPTKNYATGGLASLLKQLYTMGGELENIDPPCSEIMFKYQNRICIVPFENPTVIWPSKIQVDGVGLSFNDTIITEPISRPILAGCELMAKMVLFTDTSIVYTYGSGFDNNGNGAWAPWVTITNDVGITNYRDIIPFQNGVIFKTKKGWYLLDNGLSLSNIGLEVEPYRGYSMLSSYNNKTMTEINCLITNPIGSPSADYDYCSCLVWNHVLNKWSRDTGARYTKNSSPVANVADIICWNDIVYNLITNGGINKEDTSSSSDNGTAVSAVLETGWINYGGLKGYGRTWWIYLTGYQMYHPTIYVYYDGSSTPTDTFAFTNTDDKFRIFPSNQTADVMKVKIVTSGITIQKFLGLDLEIGVKPVLRRASYPAANTK